jgi:hypothetical protein
MEVQIHDKDANISKSSAVYQNTYINNTLTEWNKQKNVQDANISSRLKHMIVTISKKT